MDGAIEEARSVDLSGILSEVKKSQPIGLVCFFNDYSKCATEMIKMLSDATSIGDYQKNHDYCISLVEKYKQTVKRILPLLHWLEIEDKLSPLRNLESFHRRFIKLLFSIRQAESSHIYDCQRFLIENLKQSLTKCTQLMDDLQVSIQTTISVLSGLGWELTMPLRIRNGNSYIKCLQKTEGLLMKLKSVTLPQQMTFASKCKRSFGIFVVDVEETLQEILQMTFLHACGKVSNADEQLFRLGDIASEISKAENIVLKSTEVSECNKIPCILDEIIRRYDIYLERDIVSKMKSVKETLRKDLRSALQILSELKANILEQSSRLVILQNSPAINSTVRKYLQVCDNIVKTAQQLSDVCVAKWLNGNEQSLHFPSFTDICDTFWLLSREEFLKMKVIDVHNQLLTEWDKPSYKRTNLHAAADTCKKHLLSLPSLLNGITVVEFGNFEIYSNEMDNLLQECRSTISLIKSIAMLHHSGHVSGIDKLKDLLVQYLHFKLKAIEMSKSNTAGEVISETFHKDLCTCLEGLVELVNDVLIKQDAFQLENISSSDVLIAPQRLHLVEKCIVVNFFVIYQPSIWNSDVTEISLQIQFKVLKKQFTGIVDPEFTVIHHGPKGSVLRGTVLISKLLYGEKIYYRYWVSNYKSPEEMLCLQSKESVDIDHVNKCYRVLRVSNKKEMDVFDACIFPREQSASWWKTLLGVGQLLKQPNRINELNDCLESHLESDFILVENCTLANKSTMEFVYQKIMDVYSQFKEAKKVDITDHYKEVTYFSQPPHQKLMILLLDLVKKLKPKDDPHKITSALVLCRCLMELNVQKEHYDDIISMFSPKFEETECPEYQAILTTLPTACCRKPFLDKLILCLTSCIKTNGLESLNLIIRALPFYHWLTRDPPHKPFSHLEVTLEKNFREIGELIPRKDLYVKMKTLNTLLEDKYYCQLIKADPLLQILIFQICPEQKYCVLLDHIIPSVMITGISQKVSELLSYPIQRIEDFNLVLVSLLQKKDKYLLKSCSDNIMPSLLHLIATLKQVIGCYKAKQFICSEAFKETMKSAIQLLLTVVDSSRSKGNALKSLFPTLELWISTIYGSEVFGSGKPEESKVEQKLWEDLFGIESNNSDWRKGLQVIVKTRLKKLRNFSEKIKIFEALDQKDRPHNVSCALQEILEEELPSVSDKTLKRILSSDSMRLKLILCAFMERRFPTLPICLDDIISWPLWPTVLELIAKNFKDVSEYSIHVLETVKSFLTDEFRNSLLSGEISVNVMRIVEDKWESHFVKIFHALSIDIEVYKTSLMELCQRVKIFEFYLQLLEYFIKCCMRQFEVLRTAQKQLNSVRAEFQESPINSLCLWHQSELHLPCFTELTPLFPMLIPFAVMNSKQLENDLFYCNWQAVSQNLTKDSAIDEIFSDLWEPVFHFCINLVQKLRRGDITIKEAGNLFANKDVVDNIKNIRHLDTAVRKCQSKESSEWGKLANICYKKDVIKELANSIPCEIDDRLWIPNITQKIKEWCTVRKLSPIADLMLEVLNNFKTEEFLLLHKFSKQEIDALESTNFTDLSGDLNEVRMFLDKCNNETIKSLQCVSESQELMQWIRSKSSNVHEMEKFISVALDTIAGEGDVVQDRLSDLSVFCGKFSVLIYDIDGAKTDLKSLMSLLSQTLKSLEGVGDPLKIVTSCNSHLQWYQTQGELQGSVEKGAVKELEDINNFGEYSIKTSLGSTECIVSLDVDDQVEQVSHKHWSLEEIQELESKLVLITRQSSRWLEEKDCFQEILQQVCRIAELVQRLKEYGHMNYLEWSTCLPCAQLLHDQRKLQQISEELEEDLYYWISHIWNCRQKFYELNLYTNDQLITLRKDISSIRDDVNKDANSQLLLLLHSVTGQFFSSTLFIRKALQSTGSVDEEFPDTLYSEQFAGIALEDITLDENVVDDLETPQDIITDNSDEPSLLDQAIQDLDETANEIFVELDSCGYEKMLALEAANTPDITDLYSAMEWCDEKGLDEDFLQSLKQKWAISSHDIENAIPGDDTHLVSEQTAPVSLQDVSDFHAIGNFFYPFQSKPTYQKDNGSGDGSTCISLEELGSLLKRISIKQKGPENRRKFPQFCEKGTPNLIVTSPDNVLMSVLKVYMEDREKPLPCYDEVLLCSSSTTLEEVAVFWMRALYDDQLNKIYCLVHAEKLKYLVAEKAVNLLKTLSQGKTEYQLVILCSSEGEGKSLVISHLYSYHRTTDYNPTEDRDHIQRYVLYHIKQTENKSKHVSASRVDHDNFQIRIVNSKGAGTGKSLFIRRMKDQLTKIFKQENLIAEGQSKKAILTVPLHGPVVTADEVLSMLLPQQDELKSSIIHLDIPQGVLKSIDDVLFSLLILRGLKNSRGQIWRCLPTQLYAIEIVPPNSKSYLMNYCEVRRALSLLSILPSVECLSPTESLEGTVKSQKDKVLIDSVEVRTPMYQRVYQYLDNLSDKDVLENFRYIGTLKGNDQECLETIIRHCGVQNPTWKEIRHFVWFLNVQLSACEQSNLLRRVNGLKSFTVEFMVQMSRDFATSSIKQDSSESVLVQHTIRQKWEESMHPYLFFNKNRSSLTHVGLKLDTDYITQKTTLVDTHTGKIVNVSATQNVLKFLENESKIPRGRSDHLQSKYDLEKLAEFMNIKPNQGKEICSPDETYVLTQDNLTKIMGIQMRFRCRIPVVLMGETGCGKTHLVRFMCRFAAFNREVKNLFILKIHGGTTEDQVIQCIKDAEKAALKNRKLGIETVVFFDEANTSEVISLIKEVMCDGRYRGKNVPPFLKFIAACNPYKQHSKDMIEKLKNAGLGWRECDTQSLSEKLGETPMRNLVYRVLDLPSSMKALVYDFGSLTDESEREYIYQIVTHRIKMPDMSRAKKRQIIVDIANIFARCQVFMRSHKDECSFVSLRDVERATIVFNYFLETFTKYIKLNDIKTDEITISLVLAISVCYHARMENRNPFKEFIVKTFHNSTSFSNLSDREFKSIIRNYQLELLNCMELQKNIAKNHALSENIFMMFVCIELRIPLFLIGKPGSSKSLAKSIISNSMTGSNSKNIYLKNFKQVKLHSHQCSPLSTPASIIEVFERAKKYQDRRDPTSFVSVVVLDEVGLAEASPYLPLKALHPLLEDGTEGSGSDDKRIQREERVAFVGLSNWALDPAKMNRGIMVTRGDPDINDLLESAEGICCGDNPNNVTLNRLKKYFPALARSYNKISSSQKRQFFGLRDFYSLIKMLYWMSESSCSIVTKAQLLHAVKRNFSGYDEIDSMEVFKESFKNFREFDVSSDNGNLIYLKSFESEEYLAIANDGNLSWTYDPSRNAQFIKFKQKGTVSFQSLINSEYWIGVDDTLELILTKKEKQLNIQLRKDKSVNISVPYGNCTFEGIDTYILLDPTDELTNPSSTPLGLIQSSLLTREITWHGESRYLLFLTENYSALQTLKHYIVMSCLNASNSTGDESSSVETEPFVLFGSNFPKDSEYAQVCRNISEIRLCMETGRMVILLNLENLYESLYDVLNQYYIESGGHRYVDLGLRANRMKCRVHQQFKLILIAEKSKVYEEFPTPLVNRLEKHFVNTKTVLKPWQQDVCSDLEKWVMSFVDSNGRGMFREQDVFVGYNSDTTAAVVLQASSYAQKLEGTFDEEDTIKRKSLVLEIGKRLLLQLASPDGLVRYMCTTNKTEQKHLEDIYVKQQEHSSLSTLFSRLSNRSGLLIQVTTHCPSISQEKIELFIKQLGSNDEDVMHLHIEAFHTEQDFVNSVQNAFESGKDREYLLILECDSGHLNGNLISCCRYRIVDKLVKMNTTNTCILLLIHLPRKYPVSNFVSFQEQPWLCYHVDELVIPEDSVNLADMIGIDYSISDVFYSEEEVSLEHSSDEIDDIYTPLFLEMQMLFNRQANLYKQLHIHIPAAVSLSGIPKERIGVLQELIPMGDSSGHPFYDHVVKLIGENLQVNKKIYHNWIFEEAKDMHRLEKAGSFRNALIRKFGEIVVPMLAKIVTFVDQYHNLDLLVCGNDEVATLWINIFHSHELCKGILPVLHGVELNVAMTCKFPFSWIFFEHLNKETAEIEDLEEILRNLAGSELYQILEGVSVDFLECYLNDFIQLMDYPSIRRESFYKLLENALKNMIKTSDSLLHCIIAVHVTYTDHKAYFKWFSKLISLVPSILSNIEKHTMQDSDMKNLTVLAVKEVLQSQYLDLTEPLKKGKVALKGWVQSLYGLQQIIESMLKERELQIIKVQWQWVCIIRMFVEHVVLKNEEALIFFARRLEKYSSKKEELQAAGILKVIATILIGVNQGLQKGKIPNVKQQAAIRESCWQFFLEVLSVFCFGEDIFIVDQQLVKNLLDAVFPCPQSISCDPMLDRYIKEHPHKLAGLQSFLTKMLLRNEFVHIQPHLAEVVERVSNFSDQRSQWIQKQDLCMIIINYLYNQIELQCIGMDNSTTMNYITDVLLSNGTSGLDCSRAQPLQPECLWAVSQIIFSSNFVVKFITNKSILHFEDADTKYFLERSETLKQDELNDEPSYSGPIWYLLRLFVRKYGVSKLLEVAHVDAFNWILPSDELLHNSYQFIDPAAVYNPEYEELHTAVSMACSDDISELKRKKLQLVPLVLAFYQRIYLSYVSDLPSKQINPNTLDELVQFMNGCKLFTNQPKVLDIIKRIIKNRFCEQLEEMRFKSEESLDDNTIRTVIVHSVLVASVHQSDNLIKLLTDLLNNPNVLVGTFLPAMNLRSMSKDISNNKMKYPQCSNGHRYTSIMIDQICTQCGNIVHQMQAHTLTETSSTNSYGYTPQDESDIIGFLSPTSYAIIRCIIHSCLLWASCNGKDLHCLLNNIDLPPKYFWTQIKNDFECLMKATGRSLDEVSIIIHLVLREITETGRGIQIHKGGMRSRDLKKLDTMDDRHEWEKQFEEAYIKPVLKDIDGSMKHLLLKLTPRDYNQLFKVVYDVTLNPGEHNFLWQYHPRVCKDHFYFNNVDLNMKQEYPALFMLLTESKSLEATKCIPDIVSLQKLIQEIAQNYTMENKKHLEKMAFFECISKFTTADQQTVVMRRFQNLCQAWDLARKELFHYDCFDVKKEFIETQLTEDIPMVFLIPTTHGEGVITTALVDYLVSIHNSLIQKARDFVKKSLDREWLIKVREVHVMNVELSHLIDYKNAFLPLLLKHSSYVFSSGNPMIQYDLFGLEKDLVHQTVLGKPMISHITELPQVVWELKSVSNTLTVTRINRKLQQCALSQQVKVEILNELKTVAQLTQTYEVIEVVMRFLQHKEEKENPRKKIKEYVEKDLQMTGRLTSQKVCEHCCLRNVISLWKLLSIEKARIYVRNKEEPFNHVQVSQEELKANQIQVLENALKKLPSLDDLIDLLYDFIETYLQHHGAESPLKDILQLFIKERHLGPIPHIDEIFPTSIKLCQVVHIWKTIVLYQDILKKQNY